MATHAPWSREELSLLLRAWADVAARESKPRNVYHTIFQHYQALCSAARALARAEPSVHNRRKSMENMHTVISLFLASITTTRDDPHGNSTTPSPQESSHVDGGRGDSGNAGDETITGSYPCSGKLRAWFGMPETKRRRWFSVHNRKSYLYTEITKEHFDMITEILTISNGGIPPPPPVYVFKPEVHIETAAPLERKARRKAKRKQIESTLSEQELTAAMARARESFRVVMERFVSKKSPETTSTKDDDDPIPAPAAVVEEDEELQEGQAEAPPLPESAEVPELSVVPPPPPQRSDPVAEESGSATESEDDWEEIVPPSPVRDAVQESDAVAVSVTKQVSTDSLSTDTFNSRSEIESPKRKFSPTSDASLAESAARPDKSSKLVEPEIFTLLSVLEKQSRTLKEAYRSTKLARRRDQVERQEILRSLRQEQNERQQILESLRRQEEEVRQQRAAWRREQEEIRREYAELLEGN